MALFDRMGTIRDPGTIDTAWVENKVRFATPSPQAIRAMLRWLGVTDEADRSTGIWERRPSAP